MEEALRLLRAYEVWIYLLLGLGGLIYIRRFALAWQELREAAFGLERESAQARLNQSASILVLVLALAIAEFFLVSFVAPSIPAAVPLFTPTLDLLASPSPSLPATTPGAAETPGQVTPALTATPTPGGEGCVPDQIIITSPQHSAEVTGIVEITGTANIPNFGFFKLEMKRLEESNWLTILAGNQVKINDTLGAWNTSLLPTGDHQLSLVVVDNQGKPSTACIIQVRVNNPAPAQP
jgi:hypothetical protein